jgi:putative membrane protein
MPGFILTWIGNSVAIWLVAYLFRSVSVASWQTAFVAGLVLAVINAIVKPILVVLTLPITVVTLGLFYFVVTAICLVITSKVVDGFAVNGFFMTIIASIVISIFSAIVQSLLKPRAQVSR